MSYKIKNPGGIQLDVDGNVFVDLQPSGVLQVTSDFGGFAEAWYDMGTTYNAIGFGANNYIEFTAGLTTFNPIGGNNDFRMEGDTNQNLFYLDASTDRIGIGTSNPLQLVQIYHLNNSQSGLQVFGTGTGQSISVGLNSFMNHGAGVADAYGLQSTVQSGSSKRVGGLFLVGGATATTLTNTETGVHIEIPTTQALSNARGLVMNVKGTTAVNKYGIDINLSDNNGGSGTSFGIDITNSSVSGYGAGIRTVVNGANTTTNRGLDIDVSGALLNNEAIVTQRGRVIFNNSQNTDSDFQVKGLTDSNLFYLDASTDRIGIGTSLPGHIFSIVESSGSSGDYAMSVTRTNAPASSRGTNVDFTTTMGSGRSYANWTTVTAPSALGTVTGYHVETNATNTGQFQGFAANMPFNGSLGVGFFAESLGAGSNKIGYSANISGAAQNNYGIQINASGAINNNFCVYISNPTGAANNYSIYSLGGTARFNVLGDPNSDFQVQGDTDQNLLRVKADTERVGIGTATPAEKLHSTGTIRSDVGFKTGSQAGLSGTYTFGGGGSGQVATMTFTGGILTGVTLVP